VSGGSSGHSVAIPGGPFKATRGLHGLANGTGDNGIPGMFLMVDEIHFKITSIIASSQQWRAPLGACAVFDISA
jgi:hypothetical protein